MIIYFGIIKNYPFNKAKFSENSINVFDIQDMRLKDRLHTGKGPFRVKFAEPNLAIVTNHDGDTCWIFDTNTKRKLREIHFGLSFQFSIVSNTFF